jgi:hypothetical protein
MKVLTGSSGWGDALPGDGLKDRVNVLSVGDQQRHILKPPSGRASATIATTKGR